jgi:flagellar hook-length control protein FliK
MAEIQAALSAKFMQVASANKTGHKDVLSVSQELASFFSVLKSQLTKSDVPDDALPLELGAASVEKPLLVQSDADPVLPVAPGALPAESPLVNDPTLVAAAFSAAVIPSTPTQQAAVELVQDAEPASILAKQSGDAGVKTAGASRQERGGKANPVANAADGGQVLPSALPPLEANTEVVPVAATAEGKLESVVSPALSPLPTVRADAGAPTSISTAHPFEQVLRQVESKVNAAIEAPVRSAAFASELADKVVWLSGRQGQLADLSLNPPQMGSLEVRLTVSGTDASAQFFSPNPVVRDAIDAALPKLRELMAQAGLSLGEAEVRDHAFSRREGAEMQSQAAAQDEDNVANQAVLVGVGMARSSGLGLVDVYI